MVSGSGDEKVSQPFALSFSSFAVNESRQKHCSHRGQRDESLGEKHITTETEKRIAIPREVWDLGKSSEGFPGV